MKMNEIVLVGIILVVIGIVLLAASLLVGAKDSKLQVKGAFVGFIGPFPIGFGTDKQTLKWALLLGAILFVLYVVFFFFLRNR